ncbi:hypothetical protein [Variovorax sp. dw_308]|uniref:hypothetical protein n=1 Tax=Variovorax sp. dw_308 TaxID=2721546 RepID=UPI001C47CC94|nr:hypothetical protein [Variovorax sp. dw_308]
MEDYDGSMQSGSFKHNSAFNAPSLATRLAFATLVPLACAGAQTIAPLDSLQQEADYRVIAARCGTPAFEKAFGRQSKAAVVAGLVSPNRDAAAVEKSITALRRSPLTLVASSSDCPAQLAQLEVVRKQRNGLVQRSPRSVPRP